MKILIVEDEMIISEDIAMILESQGYEITDQVTNYEEAITSLTKDLPDLALLDINLASPKTGIDVGHAIKETFHIPFIYTSSLGSSQVIEEAKATNPAAYLVKPFREEQLLAAIEVAMANFANDTNENSDSESIAMFNDSIFIRVNQRFVKLLVVEIAYLKKSDNYLEINTKTDKYLIRGSIGDFLDKLSFDRMFRTNKSFAINLDFVQDITPQYVTVNDVEVPIAKSYAEDLKKHFRLF